MVMLPEVVDAVIGVDTHRDFNQLEIANPSGAVMMTGTFRQRRRRSRLGAGPGGRARTRSEAGDLD